MNFAIIGAGLSGLIAATDLQAAGHNVMLFDKGRGPGGRMSTRRAETDFGQLRFDHGAPAFEVTTPEFAEEVQRWVERGCVGFWPGPHRLLTDYGKTVRDDATAYYVGSPRMNGLHRHLAQALDIAWQMRVTTVERVGGKYRLEFEQGDPMAVFDGLIIALPYEQAIALCAESQTLSALSLPELVSYPCWSMMLAYPSAASPNWSSLRFADGPIALISHENSKPHRDGVTRFVVHASAAWSQTNLEHKPDDILAALIPEMQALTGLASPEFSTAHRWRYAQIARQPEAMPAWFPEHALGLCGDWISPVHGVEGAWSSAKKLATMIIQSAVD